MIKNIINSIANAPSTISRRIENAVTGRDRDLRRSGSSRRYTDARRDRAYDKASDAIEKNEKALRKDKAKLTEGMKSNFNPSIAAMKALSKLNLRHLKAADITADSILRQQDIERKRAAELATMANERLMSNPYTSDLRGKLDKAASDSKITFAETNEILVATALMAADGHNQNREHIANLEGELEVAHGEIDAIKEILPQIDEVQRVVAGTNAELTANGTLSTGDTMGDIYNGWIPLPFGGRLNWHNTIQQLVINKGSRFIAASTPRGKGLTSLLYTPNVTEATPVLGRRWVTSEENAKVLPTDTTGSIKGAQAFPKDGVWPIGTEVWTQDAIRSAPDLKLIGKDAFVQTLWSFKNPIQLVSWITEGIDEMLTGDAGFDFGIFGSILNSSDND